MGASTSKQLLPLDRQLHKEVPYGNVDRIRAFRAQGADLESTDSLGKTSLMKGSMWREMSLVLIELGAKVNAYRRGSCATALHHAASSGAKTVVELLIINGANPYIKNEYGETALELARRNGHLHVVWAIELHICLFHGWTREKYGPDLFMTTKIWIVVLPCEAQNNPTRPLKLELAIYHALQMLHQFYDTFRGTAEVVSTVSVQPTEPPIPSSLPENSSLAPRYAELARAINALVRSSRAVGVPNASSANTDGWRNLQRNSLNRYSRPDAPVPSMISQFDAARSNRYNGRGVPGTSYNQKNPDASSAEPVKSEANMNSSGNPWRRCVICLDAPVEGACVPCGHMAFCMPCLKDIKSKNGACPICRATINEIIRLYLV